MCRNRSDFARPVCHSCGAVPYTALTCSTPICSASTCNTHLQRFLHHLHPAHHVHLGHDAVLDVVRLHRQDGGAQAGLRQARVRDDRAAGANVGGLLPAAAVSEPEAIGMAA